MDHFPLTRNRRHFRMKTILAWYHISKSVCFTFNKIFRKQWGPACADLEKAFKIDPSHKNAKTYLMETLFQRANAISLEAKNKADLEKAQTCLEQILQLNPDHEGATKKLKILR